MLQVKVLLGGAYFVFASWYLVNSTCHVVFNIVPSIGHFPVERFEMFDFKGTVT